MRLGKKAISNRLKRQHFKTKAFLFIFFSTVCSSSYYQLSIGSVFRNLKFFLIAVMFFYLARNLNMLRQLLIDKSGLRLAIISALFFILFGVVANEMGGQGSYALLVENSVLEVYALLISTLVLFILGYMLSLWFRHNEFRLDMMIGIKNVAIWVVVTNLILLAVGVNLGRGSSFGRFSGWTDNPNTLGMILLSFFPVVFYLVLPGQRMTWKRFFNIGLLAAIILLAFTTGSRATVITMLIMSGVVLFFYSSRTRLLAILIVLMTLGTVIAKPEVVEDVQNVQQFQRSSSDVLSGRSDAWNLGKMLFHESPYFGYGFGAESQFLEMMLPLSSEHQGEYFHNSYLSLLIAVGIVGGSPFFILFAFALLRFLNVVTKRYRVDGFYVIMSSIFIGSLFHGIFESWLFSLGSVNGILFWTSCFYVIQFSQPARQAERAKIRGSADRGADLALGNDSSGRSVVREKQYLR